MLQARKLAQRGLGTCSSSQRQCVEEQSAVNPLFLVIIAKNPPGVTLPDSLGEAKGGCLPQANPLAPRRVTAFCYLRSKSQFVMIIPFSASNRSNTHGYVMQLWTIETQNRLSQRLHLLLELLSCSGWYPLQRLLALAAILCPEVVLPKKPTQSAAEQRDRETGGPEGTTYPYML